MKRTTLGLFALALASGCIATPEAPPPARWFALEGRGADEPGGLARGLPLRLRRVRAPAYLDEKVVWRRGVEVGFYQDRRWAETPANLVERALGDQLFLAGGLVRGESKAPALEVTIARFEELVEPSHEARVALGLLLRDDAGRTLLEQTVFASESVPDGEDAAAAFARAMDRALGAALRDTSRAVTEALAAARERPAG